MSPLLPLFTPKYGCNDTRHVFTATNVIPSIHVDSLVQLSPRAILVFLPDVSSSGQTYQIRNIGWQLSHMGGRKKHTGVIVGVIARIGINSQRKRDNRLLGRRCKTRLRGAPLFAIFVMICQQNRRGQRAPFLTRGSLLSPIVRSISIKLQSLLSYLFLFVPVRPLINANSIKPV